MKTISSLQRRRSIQILALAALATPLVAMQFAGVSRAVHSGAVCADAASGSAAPLNLKKGDHIAILGNVLADRMQFDGWLETLIAAQFPQHDLVVRNLSASGDEVATWHRSQDFGSRDEWLGKTKSNVIFAFYGYNESFKGPAGLPEFTGNLDHFLKDMATKDFGNGKVRVVLFSPAADEKTPDPNFPDPTKTNANLAAYTAAMAEVAKANNVQFVDLFKPSQEIYAAQIKHALTVNGHYLTDEGYKALAPIMFREIFNMTAPQGDFEKLRAAINDKNWEWHTRYRTIDGFNVYGGRSHMAYESPKGGPKITNNTVMQEEMTVRDVMTSNRDKRVWALANGKDIAVDDSNLPPIDEVKTNFPEIGPDKKTWKYPDGHWDFLSGEEGIKHMTIPPHTKVNLFASEEQFPELIKPLQMAWDGKGRLWVSVWRNYPERTPGSKVGDSILIFEDTKGTGHADKCTHFIDDLNAPTGFQFYKNGILLMQAPDVWYAQDTTGGDHANKVERVLMGMDSADSHHTTNSMSYDPGGAVYLSDGVFHRTQVETTAGAIRNSDACIYRFFPKTGEFERYIAYGFANPHGKVFDYWGNDIVTDATGNASYFAPAFSGHIDEPNKHDGMEQFWARPSRPCPGTGLITTHQFPDEYWGNFFNCNVIGFQGIYRVKMNEEGSGIHGVSLANLVSSDDPQFRPSQVNSGPDGAIYFADWSNAIIGHLQHHLRDPNRDHQHGRIYRMIYEGRPLEKPKKIAGQPIPALLELLKDPENQTRTLAKIELDKLPTADVIAAVNAWIPTLDKADPAYEHTMMEALWVHQWQNVVDVNLLKEMLRSPEPHARAAATRVLCYWRDRVPGAIDLLKIQADDESPRVRLEAERAASFFPDGRAADIALETLKHPSDYYLDYTFKQTMKQLDKYMKEYMATGKTLGEDNPAGIAYLEHNIKTDDLMKLKHTEGVLQALLIRPDLPDAARTQTLSELATMKKTSPAGVVLGSFDGATHDPETAVSLVRLLPMLSADDLKPSRDRLVKIATTGATPDIRAYGWAAVATSDETVDKAWEQASQSPATLADYLDGLPRIYDQDLRAKGFANVKLFLEPQMPSKYIGETEKHGIRGQFVRIELPHKGPLSLAEVQVFSNGRNVARKGHATQSSTVKGGGAASLAIDGKTDGVFEAGSVTRTNEKDRSAWWEVDLGSEVPIDSIVVWNRTDGGSKETKHLDEYNLIVLGADHKTEVFKAERNPAPVESASFKLGTDLAGDIRKAAIRAAVSIPKPAIQKETFAALVALIGKGEYVTAAAQGIRTLPRAVWDKSQAGPMIKGLVAWAKTVPEDDRTSAEYSETIQFATDLAGMLPTPDAITVRKELKELRVSVFVVHTVREQMRYDTPRLVVEAGKPFEIIFENGDSMDHNLAVVKPGTRPELAALAKSMNPEARDSEGRAFMPRSTNILAATKLIRPGDKQTLKLTAPTAEGVYEYFCTYPDHWQMMWGQLVVTKDVDAYLQANPVAVVPTGEMPAGHHH